jgi:hypothetical protein
MPTLKTFLRGLLAVALVVAVFFAWRWYQSEQPAQTATGAVAKAPTPAASAPVAPASAPATPVEKCECECPKKPTSPPKGRKGSGIKPPSVEKPPVATPQPSAVQPAPPVATAQAVEYPKITTVVEGKTYTFSNVPPPKGVVCCGATQEKAK